MLSTMDEHQYKERVERLHEVNAVITKLDPAIRTEAFGLLKPYVTGGVVPPSGAKDEDGGEPGGAGAAGAAGLDVDELLDKHASDKPVENGLLIAAIFYSHYGKGPYAVKEFNQFANEHNLVMPDQFHKTIGPAKRDGDKIFRKVPDGWQITVHGENWLKSTYSVTRGNERKPEK